MDKETAARLFRQSQKNYDNIAESFAQTRQYPWPDFVSVMKNYIKPGQRILDIGCANGRYYPFFMERGVVYVGIDNAGKLIDIARKKYTEGDFRVGDALDLPFAADEFDVAVAIAVIHHVPSPEFRIKFMQEISRVLKPGGILVLSVWDLRLATMLRSRGWKRLARFLKIQAEILIGKSKLDYGDYLATWQNKYERYVHVFSVGELEELAKQAGLAIEKSGVSKLKGLEANLYIIAKKSHN